MCTQLVRRRMNKVATGRTGVWSDKSGTRILCNHWRWRPDVQAVVVFKKTCERWPWSRAEDSFLLASACRVVAVSSAPAPVSSAHDARQSAPTSSLATPLPNSGHGDGMDGHAMDARHASFPCETRHASSPCLPCHPLAKTPETDTFVLETNACTFETHTEKTQTKTVEEEDDLKATCAPAHDAPNTAEAPVSRSSSSMCVDSQLLAHQQVPDWRDIGAEGRRGVALKFDWFFKSRSTHDLSARYFGVFPYFLGGVGSVLNCSYCYSSCYSTLPVATCSTPLVAVLLLQCSACTPLLALLCSYTRHFAFVCVCLAFGCVCGCLWSILVYLCLW